VPQPPPTCSARCQLGAAPPFPTLPVTHHIVTSPHLAGPVDTEASGKRGGKRQKGAAPAEVNL
jgi:hypothetical protein